MLGRTPCFAALLEEAALCRSDNYIMTGSTDPGCPQVLPGILIAKMAIWGFVLAASGHFAKLQYKVAPPNLRIEYVDGEVAEHRLVWRNLAGGALVSDLPRNLSAASAALGGKRSDRVRSVTFLAIPRWGFKKNIKVRLFDLAS